MAEAQELFGEVHPGSHVYGLSVGLANEHSTFQEIEISGWCGNDPEFLRRLWLRLKGRLEAVTGLDDLVIYEIAALPADVRFRVLDAGYPIPEGPWPWPQPPHIWPVIQPVENSLASSGGAWRIEKEADPVRIGPVPDPFQTVQPLLNIIEPVVVDDVVYPLRGELADQVSSEFAFEISEWLVRYLQKIVSGEGYMIAESTYEPVSFENPQSPYVIDICVLRPTLSSCLLPRPLPDLGDLWDWDVNLDYLDVGPIRGPIYVNGKRLAVILINELDADIVDQLADGSTGYVVQSGSGVLDSQRITPDWQGLGVESPLRR